MAQNDEIARDLVIAWLSNNNISHNINNPEKTGEAIGLVYKAVLEAVKDAALKAVSG
jgi:hypothetical protein